MLDFDYERQRVDATQETFIPKPVRGHTFHKLPGEDLSSH